jgi:hypothetical protein
VNDLETLFESLKMVPVGESMIRCYASVRCLEAGVLVEVEIGQGDKGVHRRCRQVANWI